MNTQIWTTKQLIRFSNSRASAFGSGATLVANCSDCGAETWTTQKLVNMSRSLVRAYYPGL